MGLSQRMGQQVRVTLTDLHPNQAPKLAQGGEGEHWYEEPVDARAVPAHLEGFRTIFSSFHHFRPAEAVEVLRACVERGAGIAVFEAQARTLGSMLFFLLYLPFTFAIVPLVRPWRLSRIFWTYVLPLLPLVITLDALVSCVRTYDVRELESLAAEAFGDRMDVEIGRVRTGRIPLWVTYLIATPRR